MRHRTFRGARGVHLAEYFGRHHEIPSHYSLRFRYVALSGIHNCSHFLIAGISDIRPGLFACIAGIVRLFTMFLADLAPDP